MSGLRNSAPGWVADAFFHVPAKSFVPEDVVLGNYTFLPWVRRGLAAAVRGGPDAPRAVLDVRMSVHDEGGPAVGVTPRTLTLRGPGDVVGLDRSQIIRRFPAPGAATAEENLLAHVEFDRPELPWLFTPWAADASDRLLPWLALVVCEARRARVIAGPAGFPARLHTSLGELQPLDDGWAWAHAQVLGDAADPVSVGDRLSDGYGPINLSRLLCPRRLAADKSYLAALVPAFDCGVRAALGQSGGTLEPAWKRARNNADADQEVVLPVFDAWEFATAPAGDFESLAERLHGLVAPWQVGRRMVDTSEPGGGVPPLKARAAGRVQVFRGPLVSPTPIPAGEPTDDETWDAKVREKLRAKIDAANTADEKLPRVGLRLYGRHQRGEGQLGKIFGNPPVASETSDAEWFAQLNTSPVHRIAAGLGTRVVQRDQELLMQAAWQQLGELRKTNDALVRMQFGRYVGEAIHRKHLSSLPLGELTQVLHGASDKVRAAGQSLTMRGAVVRSQTAPAALTAAFRRLTRPYGPLARRLGNEAAESLRRVVAHGTTFKDFRRVYVEPEGVRGLSPQAQASFSPELLARKLAVSPSEAARTFKTRLSRGTGRSFADQLVRGLDWDRGRVTPAQLRESATTRLTEQVLEALNSSAPHEAARAEALAPLLVGIANSGAGHHTERAKAALEEVHRRFPFAAAPAAENLHLGTARSSGSSTSTSVGSLRGSPASLRTSRGSTVASGRSVTEARNRETLPLFRFESDVSRTITGGLTRERAVSVSDTANALAILVTDLGIAALPRTPERPRLSVSRSNLLQAFAPPSTVTAHARARLGDAAAGIAADWFEDGRVAPIMVAPRFDRAMIEALADFDRDWLLPGLGHMAESDFVTVLETNAEFTTAFLVGLSDEMGRELLWRGFPTDLRGTYFHRFWNPERDELTSPIHGFDGRKPLQVHMKKTAQARVSLVVRGEVLRRYPDAIFVALRAHQRDHQGRPVFADAAAHPDTVAQILFHHALSPDLLIVGFDLTAAQLRSEDWWFVLSENPSAPRFGLDLAIATPAAENLPAEDGVRRQDLDWNDLGDLWHNRFLTTARSRVVRDDTSKPDTTTWPGNAGIVARTLLQTPVRAAFAAKELIASLLVT